MDTRKQQYENNKVQKRLRHAVGKAISDYNLIEDGDHLMICMSGGKDSYVMLDILENLRRKAPVHFDMTAVHLNVGLPGYPEGLMENYFKEKKIEYKIVKEPVYSIVREKIPDGKNICSMCSRLRRGILYRTAGEIGATKIVLGHHREDLIETLLLNLFYTGQLKAMPPKLLTDDRKNIVIRPLVYCAEEDIIKYAKIQNYPIISGELCSFYANKQRDIIKGMLKEWDKKHPGRIEIMSKALRDVKTSHLMDPSVYNFHDLKTDTDESSQLQEQEKSATGD
jgi:tRNA 2-thiocytidine biosynthesis protein TtcA